MGNIFEKTNRKLGGEIKKGVQIISAGRKGVCGITKMINEVIDKFGEIDGLMQRWVQSITQTRAKISGSVNEFDRGTKASVEGAVNDMVSSFKQM